jgi:hypothetical protein
MSYDLYFWYQAINDDIDEVVEDLADENARSVVAHPSVLAFREALLRQLPQLKDVLSPGEGSSDATSFAVLTLPFPWLKHESEILELAAKHGLSGWDPQAESPIGRQTIRTTPPPRPSASPSTT